MVSWHSVLTFVPNANKHPSNESSEFLDIKVDRGRRARRWKIHKALICKYSEYFSRACRTYPGLSFREGSTNVFDLEHDDSFAFQLFVDWLYLDTSRKSPTDFDIDHTPNGEAMGWKTAAERAWIIGDKLQAVEFTQYALGKVIQYAELLDIHCMEYIYESALPNSALRLFCSEWVSWWVLQNRSRHLWESTRNREFQRDRQRGLYSGAQDPRRFEVQHWYSQCGKLKTPCQHATRPTQKPTTSRPAEQQSAPAPSTRDRLRTIMGQICVVAIFVILGLVGLGFIAIPIVLPIVYCDRGCHGCDCYPCHYWCTHHAFLFCCDCSNCQVCGGFPFCCFVQCCCRDGYTNIKDY